MDSAREGAGAADPVTYWLDAYDRIVAVNEAWDAFAAANGGEEVMSTNGVIGQSLLDYVVGDKTRLVIDSCLRVARGMARPRQWSYRCDSPSMRRYQRMTIIPDAEETLRVEHELLRTEPIVPNFHFGFSKDRDALRRCSICNRLEYGTLWCESTALADRGAEVSAPVQVAYTVCPTCEQLAHPLPDGLTPR